LKASWLVELKVVSMVGRKDSLWVERSAAWWAYRLAGSKVVSKDLPKAGRLAQMLVAG
jgi:hypothetical protein